MYDPRDVFGLDIETDNSPGSDGLDPTKSRITEIAVDVDASIGDGEVFTGPEHQILHDLQAFIDDLQPGLLTTWNGTFFDWPFIASRRAAIPMHLDFGLRLALAPQLTPKYDYLPGHTTGYSAHWANADGTLLHAHLDVMGGYRRYAQEHNISWSLKPVARSLGIEMVELDRANLHDYTDLERKAYCLSDARGTRLLALRQLGLD
ncbi:3'-5' exonuclease [Nocardioides sp. InS609-2]|uniref:3'-5' exonuclease n=1 Tax=Nocardioides sp. InS609-2 TaxID=2760705 RepID=UPI0020BF1589|nr:3'-5' exonuclease [Nocardioides sp. InS609-2]